MLSPRQQRQALIKLLKDNDGRLGNLSARRLLSEKFGEEVSAEDYEQLKERLLSQGLIRKAKGQGGSIELLPQLVEQVASQPGDKVATAVSPDQCADILYTSLSAIPGLRTKKNKSTITVLCGEDNDKLFCGWDQKRSAYFVSYKVEFGREDCSDLAESLFKKASEDIPYALIQRYSNNTDLYLCDNVYRLNQVIRRLYNLLEDTSLVNGPVRADVPTKPRSDTYYLEIATLIKLCVDHGLGWPLKNWRKTLGFDDVDDLIVIGRSATAHLDPYREHVVPVSLIKEEAKKLAEKGAPARVIADFIRCHLYVVILNKREAALLDTALESGGMSLKNSMPEGWIFGCDPLERLVSAGITINLDKLSDPISKWRPWKGPGLRDKIRGALNTPIIKV